MLSRGRRSTKECGLTVLINLLSCYGVASGSACPALTEDHPPPYAALPHNPSATATFALNDGNKMPVFGLGVFQAEPGDQTYYAVLDALESGYRHIDTASMYENERDVGDAIKQSKIDREEIFITTKLDAPDHGYRNALRACQDALDRLGTTYIDLMLIHSPFGEKLVETWDALLHLRKQGLIRSVGVSNFGIKHIEALEEYGRPMPAVNQIEMHPLVFAERNELLTYCYDRNIVVGAYGSILAGRRHLLKNQILGDIAASYNKTPAQILLRWGFQHGFAIIPKSTSSKDRLIENMALWDFELNAADIEDLNSMKGRVDAYWDPTTEAPVHLGDTETYRDSNPEISVSGWEG